MKVIDSAGRNRTGWWVALPTVAYFAILVLAMFGIVYLVEHIHVVVA